PRAKLQSRRKVSFRSLESIRSSLRIVPNQSREGDAVKSFEDEESLLSDEQLSRCSRAYEDQKPQAPVPTRMVSNGEYMPAPQTERQRRVEARIEELSESASRKLGMDRRRFLSTTG